MFNHYGLIQKKKKKNWQHIPFFFFLLCLVEEALNHQYLAKLHDPNDEPICQKPFSFEFEQQPLDEEQIKDMIYNEAIALNPTYA